MPADNGRFFSGYTQLDVAKQLGKKYRISQTMVSRFEEMDLSVTNMRRCAAVLKPWMISLPQLPDPGSIE